MVLKREKFEQIVDTTNPDALTGNEMNVFLRLVMMQNKDTNYVQGVYWKEIVDFLGLSKSGYYHNLLELERKGYIKRVKLNRYDTDIIIKDHDLTSLYVNLQNRENYEKYLNLNIKLFSDKEFYKLKANEKRLILLILFRFKKENDGKFFYNPNQEYATYAELLGVDKLPAGKKKEENEYRCMKRYFRNIKRWIHVSDDRVIGNQVKRIVTILKGTTGTPTREFTQNGQIKEANIYAEYHSQEHILKTFLRRNKIEYDNQNLADTTWLIKQYKNKFKNAKEDIYTYVKSAILNSLEETLTLTSKAVNKILSNISKSIVAYAEKEVSAAPEAPVHATTYYRESDTNNKNKFNNFPQRQYDFDKLERELLGIKDDTDPENLILEF